MPSRRALLTAVGTTAAATAGCIDRVRDTLDGERRVDGDCPGSTSAWRTAGGDGGRTGRTDTAPPSPDAESAGLRLGRRDDGGRRLAGGLPAVGHGTAFVPSGTSLIARDPASPTGAPNWLHDVDDDLSGTPTLACGAIFALGLNTLTAVDPDTGERYWQADLWGIGDAALAVHGETAYVGSPTLAAIDVRTGDERWRGERAGAVAVDETGVYTTEHHNGTGHAAGYDHDGELRWRLALGKLVASPSVHDGTVYVADNRRGVYAIDAATGETRWSRSLDGVTKVHSGLAVRDGAVAVPAGNGDTSVLLDAATGETRWTAATGIVTGRPIMGADWVALGRTNHGVTVYDRETGRERTTWRRAEHGLGVVHGLVPIEDGFLVAGGAPSGLTVLR